MNNKVILFLVLIIGALGLSSCSLTPDLGPVNDTLYRKGASNPVVVLEEYSDFFCPHCAEAQPVIDQLLADFGDKLALEFHHFSFMGSIDVHVANECAGEQGKFFEFQKIAFEKQSELQTGGKAALTRIADGLVPDVEKFKTCLTYDKYKLKIDKQKMDAKEKYDVSATPSFVIDNQLIVIPSDKGFYEGLKEVIEKNIATPKPLA